MKSILMGIMAVAVAVTFSAPAFAGDEKIEKKGGHVLVYADEKKDEKKKDEKKGGYVGTFGEEKKDEKKKDEKGK
jgi:uncharacterized protein YxeA